MHVEMPSQADRLECPQRNLEIVRIFIQGWAVECQMESELNYNRFRKTKLNKMGAY